MKGHYLFLSLRGTIALQMLILNAVGFGNPTERQLEVGFGNPTERQLDGQSMALGIAKDASFGFSCCCP